jgi:hypothetical protein
MRKIRPITLELLAAALGAAYLARRLLQVKHPRMHRLTLLQGGAERTMQAILQVQLTAPGDDVCEQVAVEGRILLEQRLEIEGSLRGDQLIEAYLMGSDGSPLFLHVAMIWIRALVPDALENHWITLIRFGTALRTPSRYDLAMTSPVAKHAMTLLIG